MKRKVVLALVAAMTLTVGSLGTVFAMNNSQGIVIQASETSNHEHVWSTEQWVVDKEAVYEEQWVIDTPAWTETIEHPAEYEKQWVVDQEEWEEQKIVGYHTICNICGEEYTNSNDHYLTYGCASTSYTGNVPIYETIKHPEEGHYEDVLVKDAWTEYIEHEEEGHYESVLVSPEQGHWEHTCTECGEVQNSKTGEVIKPGTLPENPTDPSDPSEPTDPSDPSDPSDPIDPTDPTEPTDPEEPADPETPGTDDPTTEEPGTPDTGDNNEDQTETPSEDEAQISDKNEQEQADNSNQKTEETNQAQNSNNASAATEEKSDTTATASNENKAPKTGDPSSMIYLSTLAGSAVTGGTAFGLRKKIKK